MASFLALRKVAPVAGAELTRLEPPRLGSRDVRLRIRAASICGTDRHLWRWDEWAAKNVKTPLTFGHECCGEVVEVGSDVRQVATGDFVSVETHVPCGTCKPCRTDQQHLCRHLQTVGIDRDGGFAEYLVIPEACAWKNPPDMDPAIASIQEPLGNAVYAVERGEVAGRSVAIFGDGPIACFAVAVARAFGAASVTVVGLTPARMELARTMGATLVLDAGAVDAVAALREVTDGDGPDVVLEMAGAAAAVSQGLAAVRNGGTFIAFGVPAGKVALDYTADVVLKETRVQGIHGRRMFHTWYQVRALLESGAIDPRPVITHEFPLARFAEAFAVLEDPATLAGKILLLPG